MVSLILPSAFPAFAPAASTFNSRASMRGIEQVIRGKLL